MIRSKMGKVWRQVCCSVLLCAFVAVSAFTVGLYLDGTETMAATSVDTFAELKSACQTSGTVTITAKIAVTGTITVPKGVTVYLTCSHDAGSTTTDIYRAQGFHGHLFKVNDGATLYVRCAIDGNNKDGSGNLRGTGATGTESDGYYGQAMILNYGHVVMDNDKSVLKNNYNAYNNDYKTGLLWTYNSKKYYGLGSGGDGETDLAGSAMFCVNGKFTMSNGQIYGCYADNGPAIYVCNGYSGDTVTVSGGKIHDNFARRYGGAVFAASRKPYSSYDNSSSFVGSRTLNSTGSNAMFTVSGGSIYKNIAKLNSGAIWTGFGATFYMSGGSIYNNTAVEEGGGGLRLNAGGEGTTGGWMCFANPGGQAWIAGGSIYSNTCATNGGGITVPDNDDANNSLKITGGNIYSNTAGSNGGGVYIGSKLAMSGGNIYKNTVNGTSSKGGGIYLTGTSTGTISGGKVYSNTAVENGGGVSSYGSLTVSGGYIYGNAPYGVSFLKTGKITGGRYGVSAYTSYSEYTVSRNTKAQIHVGSDATLSIAGGTSRVVSALATDESIGANVGLLNNGTTTVATSCNADNGYMDLYGTGTSIQNAGTLTISGKLQILTSSKDGLGVQNRRGIYNTGKVTVDGDLSIRYCGVRAVQNTATGTFDMNAGAFYGNEADGNGGAVYNAGIFRMTAGSMYDNTATGAGGAVYNTGDASRFNMSGGSLYNNTAGGAGGAVYYTTAGMTSRISGGSIYKNTAGSHGGAVASYRTNTVHISGGDIYSNTATSGGGAVLNGGTLSIEEGAKIRSNTAGTYGGGIHNTGAAAVVTMSGGNIYSNKATNNGGGIYNGGTSDGTGGQLTMTGGAIYSNTTEAQGGGVYFTTDGAASTLSGGSIYSNTAVNGGGMSSFRSNGVTLSGVNVYNNTASGTGGGVRSGGKLTISSGFFYGNKSVGVYVSAGTLTISGGRYGVSAYTNYSEYTVARNTTSQITVCEGATCTINTTSYPRIVSAMDDGGAITSNYGLLNNGTVTITNNSTNSIDFYGTGTAIRNSGTLHINGYTQIISSGKDGNTTVQDRLGLYNSGGTVNVNTDSFTIAYCGYRGVNNTGTFNMKGGAIHHCASPSTTGGGVYNDGTFNMTAGSIHSNTADSGDGIYNLADGILKMSGTAIVKNGDTIYLAGTSYVTVGNFTGDKNIRANLTGAGFTAGRVVAKYATPSTGAGTDALYWNPDSPNMSQQYFAVNGKILRAGDQGAASNASSGIAAEDVFISEVYTLSFNGNLTGATVTVPASVTKYWSETKTVTFANATANVTYYTFNGWNTKADGSGNSYTSPMTYATNMNLTLYAQWKGVSYTIKYNGNGNTGGSTASSTHTYGIAKALTANGFTKTGYTFAGWNTKADGTGTSYTNQQSVKNLTSTSGGTVNLYAQWKPITYTVVYNGNGNTGGSTASSTHTYDVAKALTANGFTKTGYTFNGWNTKADGTGTSYTNQQSVKNLTSTSGGTVNLYAQWKPITYTIVYNGNGNTGGSTASSTHTYDVAKALTANGFTKTGYTFNGWNTKADGTGTSYTNQQSVKNLTSTAGGTVNLYAQWKPITYTVVYNGNGSTGGSTASSTHTYDVAKALTANGFTKTGYTFKGWNTKADGSGTSYTDKQSVINLTTVANGTVTLHAQWQAGSGTKYTVNHHLMNLDGSTYALKETESLTGTTGASLTLKNLANTYTGFTYKEGKVGGTVVTTTTILADGSRVIDLYYTRNRYTVTLNKGTGIASVTGAGTYYYGESVTINATVSTGYTWSKWSGTHSTTTKQYTFTMPASNVTDTANATAIGYKITYDENGGSAVSDLSYTIESSVTLAVAPTRTGYTFSGWKLSTAVCNWSATTYSAGQAMGTGKYGNITLVAQWTPNTNTKYTVNHYLMNLDGSTYALEDTESLTGTTGASLTLKNLANTYTGFTYKEGKVGGTVVTTTTILSDGSRVIDLYYTRNRYTVTLNKGTGIASVTGAGTYYYGESVTINATVSTGYTWSKWSGTHSATTKQYTFTMPASNVTDTANATPITYTVVYNGNGNTGGSTASSTHTYDVAKALTANGFTKTGYTFTGWNTKADGTGTAYTDKQSVKNLASTAGATVNLYAQWSPITYTVVYNGNGNTGGSTASSTHTYDVAKALTANGFTKTGYTFNGWNTKADGTGTSYTDKQSVKNLTSTAGATVNLYAQWKPITYTVIYNGNGNTGGSTSSSTHIYDVAKALSANGFTKTGYTFAGWNTKADGTGTSYTNQQSVKNLTSTSGGTVNLYAQWQPITYTVVYNGNGNTDGSTASSIHTYNVAKNLTGNGYVRTGHDFIGWNTKADGTGVSYADKQSVINLTTTANGTVTLYAQWESSAKLLVVYDGNGATGGIGWEELLDLSVADSYTLSANENAFERIEVDNATLTTTLFKFAGWQIGDTVYEFGTIVSPELLLEYASDAAGGEYDTVIVYAYWDEYPEVSAVDRWFSLDEAQNGKITVEELMKTASAIDGEVGEVTDFTKGEGEFTVIDYSVGDFTRFTASGSVTVTYRAVDKAGNAAYCTVTVYIVDKGQMVSDRTSRFVRFISSKFFKDKDGNYVDESKGGLREESVWLSDHEYNELLTDTLNNGRDKTTKEWDTVYQTWTFTTEQVDEVKRYIEEHGLGKTREDDALMVLYNTYKA